MAAAGQLRYRLAASRDGGEGVARTYVQHLLAEDGERVADALVKKEGWVYLSGCVAVLAVGGTTRC
jgi:sulfite reductase alpha subunit-like flavoprotein